MRDDDGNDLPNCISYALKMSYIDIMQEIFCKNMDNNFGFNCKYILIDLKLCNTEKYKLTSVRVILCSIYNVLPFYLITT